jgi:integrase
MLIVLAIWGEAFTLRAGKKFTPEGAMASDLRYMKLGRGPGSTWFFVYNIPKDLRGHPRFMTSRGKPMTKITESLETTDPEKAREARNRRIVYWDRQFRTLRDGPSEDDIREAAVEVYRAAIKAEAERPAGWGRPTPLAAEWLKGSAEERQFIENYFYPRLLAEAIEEQVAGEIAETGLQPGTERYLNAGARFIEAKIAAGVRGAWLPLPDGREIRGEEQRLPQVEPPVPAEPKPITDPPLPRRLTETFSEAFERYLATELDGTGEQSITDYRRKVKVFTDKVGDLPLGKITDHTAVEFLDDYLLGERKVSPRTRNGYAMLFSAIYKCAIRRKKANSNPFDGQRIKAVTKHYEPFTDQELATLFADAKFEVAPDKHRTGTALPWASLISAYTGCRLEEVAQLKAADIKQTDGIWYFEFCHDGNGKTEAATRVVPLHRALIDTGLLRYRDALPKDSMLFPGLKTRESKGKLGSNLGDAFSWWRKKLGIVRPSVNFHSFRHTVGDRLRKAGVPEDDRAALLGHEDERITSRVYGHDGPGLHRLQAIVDKISYRL